MNETTMIRISNKLKDDLKKHAQKEGRTLEWVTNQAISAYLYKPVRPQAQPSITEPIVIPMSQDPDDRPRDLGEVLREQGN